MNDLEYFNKLLLVLKDEELINETMKRVVKIKNLFEKQYTVKDLTKFTGLSRFPITKKIKKLYPEKVIKGKRVLLTFLEAENIIKKFKGFKNFSLLKFYDVF